MFPLPPSARWPRAGNRYAPRDDAVADAFSNVLLIGVVVTVVGVVMAGYAAEMLTSDPEIPTFATLAVAEPGGTEVILTHAGGDVVDQGRVRVTVSVGGEVRFQGALGATGTSWSLGDALIIGPLSSPVAAGDHVEVVFTGAAQGGRTATFTRTMATVNSAAVLSQGPVGSGIPSVYTRFANGLETLTVKPSQTFSLVATVAHKEGRSAVANVVALITGISTTTTTLYDDGTHGDIIAGDGTYTGTLQVPIGAPSGPATISVTASDVHGNRATDTLALMINTSTGAAGPGVTQTPAPAPQEPATPFGYNVTPPPIAPVLPQPIVTASNGLGPVCVGSITSRVVGTQITYGAGGPNIPVTMQLTSNGGGTWTPLFGGAAVIANQTYTLENTSLSMRIGIGATASYSNFYASYNSTSSDPHVLVLRNGQVVPEIAPFGNQSAVTSWLLPYLSNGSINIANNQVIFLFEFNANLTSTASDFQDLVVLMTFPTGTCPAASVFTSMAAPPTGAYDRFTLIGMEKNSSSSGPRGGHVMFVPLNGTCEVRLIEGKPGKTSVKDSMCMDDGRAAIEIAPGAYDVFVRMGGQPGGSARFGGCFVEDGSSWCGSSQLNVTRGPDGSIVTDGSGAFLTQCVMINGELVRRPAMEDPTDQVLWNYEGDFLRVTHMRVYPAANATPQAPC